MGAGTAVGWRCCQRVGAAPDVMIGSRPGHQVGAVVANAVDVDGYLRFGERPRDADGKPQLLPIGYRRIRRLTPIECERLQGFPDNWTKGISDSQRYKCLGNAVTVNVIEAIGRQFGRHKARGTSIPMRLTATRPFCTSSSPAWRRS